MAVKEISNNLFFTNVRNIINSGNSVELKIKGTSMYPTLLNGEHKVVLTSYQKQYLRIGIILLFVYKEKYILHRLVSINENQLILQGDNQPYIREYIEEKDIVGMVEYIISPTGKVTDCKKRRFFVQNRFWRPIYQYHLFFVRKMKGFFIKTFAYT
ncbi:S24/S26 family peptidase [Dysgonomonas sp. ZJ709]|uniref:S24/S26 family peptidase n=1 Tax=Dysgonomonas sp. ZJ709 TaxID=2709797 RepID=UPI0013EB976E|nr:S24/S26 family peptidase [Dysgonomonas sp. ZJ709]